MDDASRTLVDTLLDYSGTFLSSKANRAIEKGVFDIMARIAVIHHAGKLPPDMGRSQPTFHF